MIASYGGRARGGVGGSVADLRLDKRDMRTMGIPGDQMQVVRDLYRVATSLYLEGRGEGVSVEEGETPLLGQEEEGGGGGRR